MGNDASIVVIRQGDYYLVTEGYPFSSSGRTLRSFPVGDEKHMREWVGAHYPPVSEVVDMTVKKVMRR